MGVSMCMMQPPQFNSQDRLHQFSAVHPSADDDDLLQLLQQRFSSSASLIAAAAAAGPAQQLMAASCDAVDDVTGGDDVSGRSTCRRQSVASSGSGGRAVSFLRLRSHSLRYVYALQTRNWVIWSPGRWVIWVIFHARVTGSSF